MEIAEVLETGYVAGARARERDPRRGFSREMSRAREGRGGRVRSVFRFGRERARALSLSNIPPKAAADRPLERILSRAPADDVSTRARVFRA